MARGRPKKAQPAASGSGQGAVTGYESEMWGMADALRGSMDASEYKHVVLGLIFLKYISDACTPGLHSLLRLARNRYAHIRASSGAATEGRRELQRTAC